MNKPRIQIKHDTAENWAKAVNFIPLEGELIIYDGVIEDGKYIKAPMFKVGDGIHKVSELPFMNVDTAPLEQPKLSCECKDGKLIIK